MPKHAFILGIHQRSGTNFLSDLLALHPRCTRPKFLHEDFFCFAAPHLARFVETLHENWDGWREAYSGETMGLILGQCLCGILQREAEEPGKLLVSKTPRADNIAHFPWLFPEHPLLVLVRDGRAVVESSVKSFKWTYKEAMTRWATGAQRILEFHRDHRRTKVPYLIIRYEDLVLDLEQQLCRILAFLKLPEREYDFAAAKELPVRGSSELVIQGEQLHWEAMPKRETFNPLARGQDWSSMTDIQFQALAGGYQRLFGYSFRPAKRHPAAIRALSSIIAKRWRSHIAKAGLVRLRLEAKQAAPLAKRRAA